MLLSSMPPAPLLAAGDAPVGVLAARLARVGIVSFFRMADKGVLLGASRSSCEPGTIRIFFLGEVLGVLHAKGLA